MRYIFALGSFRSPVESVLSSARPFKEVAEKMSTHFESRASAGRHSLAVRYRNKRQINVENPPFLPKETPSPASEDELAHIHQANTLFAPEGRFNHRYDGRQPPRVTERMKESENGFAPCVFSSLSVNIWMNRPQNNWVSRIAEPRLPGHGEVSVAEPSNLLSRVFRSQRLAARSLDLFFAILLKVDLACVRGTLFFFVRASIANTSEGICGFVSRHLKSGANGPRGGI